MTETETEPQGYGIEVDRVGNVLTVEHELEEDGDAACPFHNPSVHPLALAPIRYSAAAGLVRVCQHGNEHPDRDDHRSQMIAYPIFAKIAENQHDKICCGCCLDEEPVAKRTEPGSHRADTGIIPIAARAELEDREEPLDTPVRPVAVSTPDLPATAPISILSPEPAGGGESIPPFRFAGPAAAPPAAPEIPTTVGDLPPS